MSTAQPKITLYVDTVSPFAYIAYYILRHDAVFSDCHITYVPIFLGGLMKACGNTPPINIKNKDKWINRERQRWAETFGIPMHKDTPADFPPLTLGIMRHLAALDELDGDDQTRLVQALDALFRAFWVEHDATHTAPVLQRVLRETLGIDEADRVAAAAGQAGKQALVRNTDKAFDHGAFGLPWMVCTTAQGRTEGFWGVDHLGQVAAFMGLKPPSGPWTSLL